MKVAMFVTGFPLPSETFVLDQIEGMARRGCEVTIFAEQNVPDAGPQPNGVLKALTGKTLVAALPDTALARGWAAVQLIAARWPNVPWKSLNAARYGRRALALRLFFEASACTGCGPFDVVHCHFGPNGIRAAALREIGAIRTRALVTSFYGYDLSEFIRPRNPYSRLFRQGDRFLPLSESMRARLIALGCPDDRILVHRLGVTPDAFAAGPRCGTGPVRIVSIARLVEKKGLEYGIRAIAVLMRLTSRDVRYTILGDGPLRPELEKLIESLGLSDLVRLEGWCDRFSVRRRLAESDILLAPSVTSASGDEEGTPTAILEAMASGLSVVSTFHAGIPEVVEDGVSGVLVAERDIAATANALRLLVDDRGLRQAMGLAGRAFVSTRHNIDRLNDTLLEIYRQTSGFY